MSNHHDAHIPMRKEAAYRKITFENEAQKNCPFFGKLLNTIKSMIPGDGGSLCEIGGICSGCGAAGVLSYELDHPYQTVWESEPRDSAFRFDPDAWA